MRNLLLSALFIVFAINTSNASVKRVIGFVGSWHGESTYNNQWGVQYHKLTDVVYSFMLPQIDGSIAYTPSTNTFFARLGAVVNHAKLYGTKVHISAGGWTASNYNGGGQRVPEPIHEMVNNPTARTKFVNEVLRIIEAYNLDGFNMDWEYPNDNDGYVLDQLMFELKKGISDLEKKLDRDIELSIAVAAGNYGSVAYSSKAISYADMVMIMAFDNNGDYNHSTAEFAKTSVDFWTDVKGAYKSKVILGIPLYSGGNGATSGTYASFSNRDPEMYYNDLDGNIGSYRYNSKPVIEEKLKMLDSEGASGIFVWEAVQDRKDQYSLLSYIYNYYYPDADLTLNTNEIQNTIGFSVFPTNVQSNFQVSVSGSNIDYTKINYSIVSITGAQISSGQITSPNQSVQLPSSTANGLYFVKIIYQNQEKTFKIIKK